MDGWMEGRMGGRAGGWADARARTHTHTHCPLAVHSLHSLSYDKSIAASKVSSPQSAIYCCVYQFPASSHFLQVIQQLLMSSSSSCNFPVFFFQ